MKVSHIKQRVNRLVQQIETNTALLNEVYTIKCIKYNEYARSQRIHVHERTQSMQSQVESLTKKYSL